MNARHLEATVSSMCGVSGYGVFILNVHWTSEGSKFIVAMITAFFAGAIGYLGQQGIKFIVNKIKNKNA